MVFKADIRGRRLPGGYDAQHSTAFYKMLVPLIQHLALSGPVLVIESTIPRTINTAKAIASELDHLESPSISQLMDMVETKLGPDHSLRQILPKGVAYHHGSLPHEIRASIEDSVGQGQLNILVATTTMTDGINLPVKSVIIASQGSFTEGGYAEYITGPKLINAIGRAGRAAKETEGIIVLALRDPVSPDDFKRFTPDPSEIEIISNIATQKALEALSAFEELVRQKEDAIFQAKDLVVSKFLSFIWYFAAEIESLGNLVNDEKLYSFLSKTLAWSQLNENDQKRWFSVAQEVAKVYGQIDTNVRRRWASSSTSLGSSQELEKIVHEVSIDAEALKEPITPIEAINMILGNGRLEKILALPESPQKKIFATRSGQNRQEIHIPIRDVIQQWINGQELITISNSFFGDIRDVDFRFEQLGEFISKYFENFFPWILGTIVNWTNFILAEKGAAFMLPRSAPAFIRWGVENTTALD